MKYNNPGFNSLFFSLHNQVKPLNHSHDLPPPGKKGRPYICSCMIFLHPTPGAKLLMRKWIEELQAEPWSRAKKANDQPGFNWALMKTSAKVWMLCFLSILYSINVGSFILWTLLNLRILNCEEV